MKINNPKQGLEGFIRLKNADVHMKNFYTLLILCLIVASLSAQIPKGTVLIGGTTGINNLSESGTNITEFNVSPSVAGFFLGNRFALGAVLNLEAALSDGSSAGAIGLSPFARYYFNDSGSTRTFGQVQVGVRTNLSENNATALLTCGLGIGADFFLNDRVAIEGLLGYQRVQGLQNIIGLSRIGLNFGIAAFIGGGKK